MTYTEATEFFDYHSDNIQALIADLRDADTQTQITELYLKVRDGWRYNPYDIGINKEHYIASHLVEKKEGHCIDKAIIYIAGLRALGIPARLHLAKVSNHIATEQLEKMIGSNELAPHGFVDVYYNGKWAKCSPAFNKELCERYNVDSLTFDGTTDSIIQEYNRENKKFMSYLDDYGYFNDVPLDRIREILHSNYPQFFETLKTKTSINLADM